MTTIVEIPTLHTERLIMRAQKATDYPTFVEICTNEDTMRFIGGTLSKYDSWRPVVAHAGQWVVRGFGMLIIADPETDEMFGYCGGFYPENWPEQEIGWTLHEKARGRGYATEAATTMRKWLYEVAGWNTMISCIDPANTASIAVAERLGATFEKNLLIRGEWNAAVYRHPSREDILGGTA